MEMVEALEHPKEQFRFYHFEQSPPPDVEFAFGILYICWRQCLWPFISSGRGG